MEKLVSTAEAARELHISTQRVRQLIAAGRLKATRVGRNWVVQNEDLEAVRNRIPGRPKRV